MQARRSCAVAAAAGQALKRSFNQGGGELCVIPATGGSENPVVIPSGRVASSSWRSAEEAESREASSAGASLTSE